MFNNQIWIQNRPNVIADLFEFNWELIRPGPCIFKRLGSSYHCFFVAPATHNLQTDRKSINREASRSGSSRISTPIKWVSKGSETPQFIRHVYAVNHRGMFVNFEGGRSKRWCQQQIVILKKFPNVVSIKLQTRVGVP